MRLAALDDADGGLSSGEAGARSAEDDAAPVEDALRTDVADAQYDAESSAPPTTCPAPDDPYWTQVFAPAWGDASVCGVVEAGHVEGEATVTGQLYCALVVHDRDASTVCPFAICNTQTSWMGRPCAAFDPAYVDGAAEPVIGDAGECLLAPETTFTTPCGQGGRRPYGLGEIAARGTTALGAHFAHQAAFEAVSVVAFERLATELDALGAPRTLGDACLDAAREEMRHATMTSALAARFGGRVFIPELAAPRSGTLVDFAIENAVEGLVHETFAAAVAVHQSRCAADVDVRYAMAPIAAEELGHAELSRRIHAWACARLSREERSRVAESMRGAIDALRTTLDERAVEASLVTAGGLPDSQTACIIHKGLEDALWSHDLQALAPGCAGDTSPRGG